MITASGRKVEPHALNPQDICIEDIAHHLSMLCRFTGACRVFYSVATHSLMVADLVREHCRGLAPGALVEMELCALLHDATEAYLADLSTPVKGQIEIYRDMERAAWWAIAERYGLPMTHPAPVKHADLVALATERRDLMPQHDEPWSVLEGIAPHRHRTARGVTPSVANAAFLDRFYSLHAERLAAAARSVV